MTMERSYLQKLDKSFQKIYSENFFGGISSTLYVNPSFKKVVSVPTALESESESEDDSLMNEIYSKISKSASNNPTTSILVTGHSGLGKTTLGLMFGKFLWDKRKENQQLSFIPIYINLPHNFLEFGNESLSNYLATSGIKDEIAMKNILENQLILILDGYDEFHSPQKDTTNIYSANGWGNNISLVILSRLDSLPTFQEKKESLFKFEDSGIFLQYALDPFNAEQIEEYICRFVKFISKVSPSDDQWIQGSPFEMTKQTVEGTEWEGNPKLYIQWLNTIPDLKKLATTPFILTLIAQVLPALALAIQNSTARKLQNIYGTMVGIYDFFTNEWFKFQTVKVQMRDQNIQESNALGKLNSEFIMGYFKSYAENLAQNLLNVTNGLLEDKLIPISPEEFKLVYPWRNSTLQNYYAIEHKNIFPLDENDQDPIKLRNLVSLRKGCLIQVQNTAEYVNARKMGRLSRLFSKKKPNKDGHWVEVSVFCFLHRSLVEFFAAKELFKGAIVDFGAFVANTSNTTLRGWNLNRVIVNERNILVHLSELVNTEPEFKNCLLSSIQKSSEIPGLEIMASNAVTILNISGFNFSNMDLRYVEIPSANLSYALCAHTDFRGANLVKVKFDESWLVGAKFQGASLSGVDFGVQLNLDVRICEENDEKEYPFHVMNFNNKYWLVGHATTHGKFGFSPDRKAKYLWFKISMCEMSGKILRVFYHQESNPGEFRSFFQTFAHNYLVTFGSRLIKIFNVMNDQVSEIAVTIPPNDSDPSVRTLFIESISGRWICLVNEAGFEIFNLNQNTEGTFEQGDQIFFYSCLSKNPSPPLGEFPSFVLEYEVKGQRILLIQEKTISIFQNFDSKNPITTLEYQNNDKNAPQVLSFSKSGTFAAVTGIGFSIQIFELSLNSALAHKTTLLGHSDRINCVQFSSNFPYYLASGSDDFTVRIWKTTDWNLHMVLRGFTSYVKSVAFADNDSTQNTFARKENSLAIVTYGSTDIKISNIENLKKHTKDNEDEEAANTISQYKFKTPREGYSFSYSNEKLAVHFAENDYDVEIFGIQNGEILYKFNLPEDDDGYHEIIRESAIGIYLFPENFILFFVFISDGSHEFIIYEFDSNSINPNPKVVGNGKTEECKKLFENLIGFKPRLSSNGQYFAFQLPDSRIQVWNLDLEDRKFDHSFFLGELVEYYSPGPKLKDIMFAAANDDKILGALYSPKQALETAACFKIWNVESQQCICCYTCPIGGGNIIRFNESNLSILAEFDERDVSTLKEYTFVKGSFTFRGTRVKVKSTPHEKPLHVSYEPRLKWFAQTCQTDDNRSRAHAVQIYFLRNEEKVVELDRLADLEIPLWFEINVELMWIVAGKDDTKADLVIANDGFIGGIFNLCCFEIDGQRKSWSLKWASVSNCRLMMNDANIQNAFGMIRLVEIIAQRNHAQGTPISPESFTYPFISRSKIYRPLVGTMNYGSEPLVVCKLRRRPRNFESFFISENNWVVSAIKSGKRRTVNPVNLLSLHVYLILEGILNARRFIVKFDLTYDKVNEIVQLNIIPKLNYKKQIKYVQRSLGRRWNISDKQGKDLVNNILEDRQIKRDYDFLLHNCVEWARSQLEQIGIPFDDHWYHDFVIPPNALL